MKGGTLFSGIGAPECAMPAIDWRWAAEIDPFACAVHKARFPDVPNLGDVTEIDPDAVEPVDIIVFGSPCQDFSVAGNRRGMDGARGNLTLAALTLVGQLRPRWLVFENVPGLLSNWSGDPPSDLAEGDECEADQYSDFAAFLGAVRECGYLGCWRVFDAQFAGVPQRRRRVFFVGHLGDWRPAAAVLFESESLRGDTAPRREAGQKVARPVASCIEGGSGYRNDADRADDLIAFSAKDHGADAGEIAPTLRAMEFRDTWANGGGQLAIARSLNAHPGRIDGESETFVLRSDAVRVGEAKTPSADAKGRVRLRDPGFNVMLNAVPTIDGGAAHIVTHSLRADGFDAGEDGTGRGTPLVAFQSSQSGMRKVQTHATLDANMGSRRHNGVSSGMTVRRLTPRECERLQGFPDDYTLVSYRGKPAADGPRYRAIGNSMAVPVMRWILERIVAAHRRA